MEGTGNLVHGARAGVRGVELVQQQGTGCYRLFKGRNYHGESLDLLHGRTVILQEEHFEATKIK